MSTQLFPFSTLENVDFKIERSVIFATEIQTGASGIEQRASFQATPRYKYKIKITCREYANGDEIAYINNLWENHYGEYESFYILDPQTGMEVNVRFDMDELKWTRVSHHQWWECEINLISVKGGLYPIQPEIDGPQIQ